MFKDIETNISKQMFLTNIENISKTIIHKYADIGSPCRAPF